VPTGKIGFSFSNLRDTSSTQVEIIDPTLTDLFLGHKDTRMARFYNDPTVMARMPSRLDGVIDQLEKIFDLRL
jgi:hypothetical protein